MNLQQGRGFLADLFISRSKNGAGTIYTVPTADQNSQPPIAPTTALVKSIRLSNQSGGAITTTVTMMDSSESSLEIELYKDSLADGAETEVLTQPIVLEQADAIKLVGGVKILVSLMEIT
jgi:hypothetical protein